MEKSKEEIPAFRGFSDERSNEYLLLRRNYKIKGKIVTPPPKHEQDTSPFSVETSSRFLLKKLGYTFTDEEQSSSDARSNKEAADEIVPEEKEETCALVHQIRAALRIQDDEQRQAAMSAILAKQLAKRKKAESEN